LTSQHLIAARVAAQIRQQYHTPVELVRGGLGELSVFIDGRKAVTTNRFWYSTPTSVLKRVHAQLKTLD